MTRNYLPVPTLSQSLQTLTSFMSTRSHSVQVVAPSLKQPRHSLRPTTSFQEMEAFVNSALFLKSFSISQMRDYHKRLIQLCKDFTQAFRETHANLNFCKTILKDCPCQTPMCQACTFQIIRFKTLCRDVEDLERQKWTLQRIKMRVQSALKTRMTTVSSKRIDSAQCHSGTKRTLLHHKLSLMASLHPKSSFMDSSSSSDPSSSRHSEWFLTSSRDSSCSGESSHRAV